MSDASAGSLRLVGDLGQGAKIFNPDRRLTLGREEPCEILVPEGRVSRRHAEIRIEGNGLVVEDLGSSNGTFVNGLPVFAPHRLGPGDTVQVGNCELHVTTEAEAPALAAQIGTAPARSAPADSPAATLASADSSAPARSSGEADGAKTASRLPLVAGLVIAVGVGAFFATRGDSQDPVQQPDSPAVGAEAPDAGENSSDQTAGDSASGSEQDANGSAVALSSRTPGLDRDRQRFEDALERGRFRQAERALTKLGTPEDLHERYDRAALAHEKSLRQEFAQRQKRDGLGKASGWLRLQLSAFPQTSPARIRLNEMLFGLATGGELASARGETQRPIDPPAEGALESTPSGKPAPTSDGASPATSRMGAKSARRKLELADTSLAARRTEEAADLYREVIAAFPASNTNALLRRAHEGMESIEDYAELVENVVRMAQERNKAIGRIPFEGRRPSEVLGVDSNGVTFAQREGDGLLVPWRLLPTASFVGLATRVNIDPDHVLTLSAVVRRDGDQTLADELLAKLIRRSPGMEDDVFAQLSRVRGFDAVPEGGFKWFEDQWLTLADLERAKLRERVEGRLADLANPSAEIRANAFEQLVLLGDVALGRLRRELDRLQDDVHKELTSSQNFAHMDVIRAKRELLDERRKTALDLIFDRKEYPYPYNPGRGGTAETLAAYTRSQPRVAELTKAVAEVWEDKAEVSLNGEARNLIARLGELGAWRVEVGLEERPIEPDWLLTLPAGNKLNVRNFAWSAKERRRIDKTAPIMAANARFTRCSAGERTQIKVTNEYRFMMGRWALELSEALFTASDSHCADMSRLGFFSHTSPIKGRETPTKRANQAGYTGGVGENIAISSGPTAAHHAWLRSPGHHRNILYAGHRAMGPGNSGRYWCQVFGSSR